MQDSQAFIEYAHFCIQFLLCFTFIMSSLKFVSFFILTISTSCIARAEEENLTSKDSIRGGSSVSRRTQFGCDRFPIFCRSDTPTPSPSEEGPTPPSGEFEMMLNKYCEGNPNQGICLGFCDSYPNVPFCLKQSRLEELLAQYCERNSDRNICGSVCDTFPNAPLCKQDPGICLLNPKLRICEQRFQVCNRNPDLPFCDIFKDDGNTP